MPAQTLTFTFTGAAETWFVPNHTAGTLVATLYGGRGGDGDGTPQAGFSYPGAIQAVIDLTPGQPVTVIVGGGTELDSGTGLEVPLGPTRRARTMWSSTGSRLPN